MTVGLNKPRGGGGGGRGGSRGGRGGARGGRGSSPGGRGRGGDTRGGRGRGGGSRGRGGGDARKDYNSSAGKKQNPLKRAIGESGTKKFRQGGGHGNDGGRDGNTKTHRRPTGTPSARTKEIDIHLASKIAHDFTKDINIIKDKLQGFTFDSLDDAFRFVPPTYVMQHLPTDVTKFRTYFSKFNKGSKNDVIAFVKWFEWASYEAGKTLSGIHHQAQKHKPKEDAEVDAAGDDDGDAVEGGDATTGSKRKVSHSRATLAQLAKEREHMRALLQMCLRHNCTKRREGQRALINHLNSHLNEQSQSKSFAALKEDAHHSVAYAVSRLILGMVTENFANVALYCQTLHMVLQQTPLHPRVIISLLGDSLSLDARMKAQEMRTQMAASGDAVLPTAADDLDPDDISDPTKGERNQRIAAAVFAMAAVLTSRGQAVLAPADTQQVAQYLSYCYIENKGIRVLSGNLLLMLLGKQKQGADGSTGSPLALLSHAETWKWVQFAFFRFPKLEYYRPEAVQLMIQIMQMDAKPTTIVSGSSSILLELSQHDPLEPSVLEQFANALFRRDQVTAVHPMVHPVWYDLLELIKTRCAQGESLKQHLSTFVHTVIAPYRRGASESPRNTLFLKIVDMVGSLALQHEDADDRMEVVRIATKSVGFGKLTTTKATPIAELRTLSIETMSDKLNSLVKQLGAITDNEPASVATRTWTLKELRSCLLVPYREGTDLPALNQAMMALLQLGFFPRRRTSDEVNLNRAVYLFADVFSFTYTKPGGMSRVKASVSPNTIIAAYLEAEDAKKTRFSTAVNHVKFRKARNRIVEALENDNVARSVLFYDPKDMRILLTLLFLMLSVDDHTNEAAVNIASNIIPDLARFYKTGTIESIDVLYDVMMALVLRPTAPMHVLPLMASIRRIATGYLYRYARFITDRRSLDIVLAPLVEGYQTNEREAARNRLAGDSDDEAREDGEDDDASASSESVTSNSDDEASDEEGDASDVDKEEEEVAVDEEDDDEEDSDDGDQDNEESDDASTVADSEAADDDAEASAESVESSDDDDDDDGDDTDASNASGEDEENANDDDGWNTEEGEFVEEEKPTQHYLNSLQQLAGNIDLGFAYPTDTENKQKSDVVRSINIATRVGLGMRSPLVVHVFQVLLAVLRSEVKSDDPVIFDAAKANITMLMMSRQRYFGRFLEATELLQLLGDIQTYCRKLVRYVIPKDKAGTRQAAMMRKRLLQLKMMALSVFHYTCYLAHKNHADESVRITYMEFYQSLFYDRGWEKSGLSQLKRDLYHYRHGFAWALLPTAVQKFEAMKYVEGAQRVLAFNGACAMVESMLSRVSGLPQALKASASANIRSFITSPTLVELFEMKQTSLYTFFHVVKMALEYNSKIQLDTDHITALVKEIVDNDNLQVTKATVRVIASIERLLNLTPMIRETKAPVPVQVLYKQFETKWRKDKSEFHRKAKIAKKKTAESLLAHRNDDPTDEERAKKRRRREELKVVDREERETLRAMRNRDLTKEEKDARRKRMGVAKQERIAKNKDRKRQLHEKRTASFVRWREEKLSSA